VTEGDESAAPTGSAATDALTSHGSELSGTPSAESAAVPAAGSPAELSSEAPAMPAGEVAEQKREVASQAAVELVAILRPSLKETRSGSLAAEVGALAGTAGKTSEDLLNALVGLGLRIPEKAREKAATIEVAGETISLTRNAKDEIWLNVKSAGERKAPRRARRGPTSDEAGETGAEAPEAGSAPAAGESPPAE
jgi:hypothetical protein